MDNDNNNNTFIPAFEGLNVFAKTTAEVIEFIAIDTDTIIKPLKTSIDKLAQVAFNIFEIYNADIFENLSHTLKVLGDGIQLSHLQSLGALEWCNIDAWINPQSVKLKDIEEENEIPLSYIALMKLKSDNADDSNKADEEDRFDLGPIDRFIGKHFTKEIVKDIEEDTIPALDDQDVVKLKKAMIDFRARRYLESATLLASLIDAQNIKQELFDLQNDKYSDDFYDEKNDRYRVDQGWHAFRIVFKNNFTVLFDGEDIGGKGKRKNKEEAVDHFVENIKGKLPSDKNDAISIISLMFCLLNFFRDSDFRDYPGYRPIVINRHWLMHGMYDVDDIDRYDCIKLLLMLNQMSKIYKKLK